MFCISIIWIKDGEPKKKKKIVKLGSFCLEMGKKLFGIGNGAKSDLEPCIGTKIKDVLPIWHALVLTFVSGVAESWFCGLLFSL